jgi:polygalacturonase
MMLKRLTIECIGVRMTCLNRTLLESFVAIGLVAALGVHSNPANAQASSAPSDAVIPVATGSGVVTLPKSHGPTFDILAYGAKSDGPALANQTAINAAIDAAAAAGGGTVVIPQGTFKTYSIRLKSNVELRLATKDSILRAAVAGTGEGQDGGFYDAPEKNLFVGIQDGGHSHWANSLIYGIDVKNVTISGPGLIDGSYLDARGLVVDVLAGGDPREAATRDGSGVPGGANKAIGLKNADHIVFRDFHIKNGGHFAILGTNVNHWTVDGIVVDTDRDAFDIDTCQNMTVRNSVFNSLTDDALVLKGSFGAGKHITSKNILIENDTVSGYDAGSVLDKVYSTHKLVASDRDGPTGRVKFGTEGSSGLDTVTIRHMIFDRSRGFALESVDGAELKNILFTDVRMKHISSSPIFIDIGDRGRTPVTGTNSGNEVSPANNVRLADTSWILPNVPAIYGSYPPQRYIPAYDKSTPVSIGGTSARISIVNPDAPARLNPNSIHPKDPLFANAVGSGFASIHNIEISNVVVEDADPRYPILLNGLVDHPIENVRMSNVTVEYRGGLTMEHATEQRQLSRSVNVTPYQSAASTQSLAWLVNTFFSKGEGLLPRVSWDASANSGKGSWTNDPYNIPEMTREYPEPSMLGILPAYGIYARHVRNIKLSGIILKFQIEDKRPAIVLDDAADLRFNHVSAMTASGVPTIVKVTNIKKRPADEEYVKNIPYKTTVVSNLVTSPALRAVDVTVDRPSPGTPPDSLYLNPTAPSAAHPYSFSVVDDKYPLPATVFRPSFDSIGAKNAAVGQTLQFAVIARSPDTNAKLTYSAANLPTGATFDPSTRTFSWTPVKAQAGSHTVKFTVDDGVLPVSVSVTIDIK